MVWLEYQKSDGYVVKISDIEPVDVPAEHGVVTTSDFAVNDEFKYIIYVHVNQDGDPTGQFAAIQQAPAATYILEQLAQKDAKIAELEQIVADLSSLLIDGGVI